MSDLKNFFSKTYDVLLCEMYKLHAFIDTRHHNNVRMICLNTDCDILSKQKKTLDCSTYY